MDCLFSNMNSLVSNMDCLISYIDSSIIDMDCLISNVDSLVSNIFSFLIHFRETHTQLVIGTFSRLIR